LRTLAARIGWCYVTAKAAAPGCGTMAYVAAEHQDSLPMSPSGEGNGGRLTSDPQARRPGVALWLAGAAGRLAVLDWIAIGLFTAGAVCVATGLLPTAQADATVRRILPLLLFLASVIVLAELTAGAEVFDVIASRVAIVARGNYLALFVLCTAFAAVTTITLNLDTTAVLLTPVMLALGRKLKVSVLPLAMTTVWLANTASLLLPVSNLTNLLAANRVALTPVEFAGRMWAPQLASIAATMAFLWAFYWRRGQRGTAAYDPPAPHVPRDRRLFLVASAACVLFIAGILTGLPLGLASSVSAGLVVISFAARSRESLRPALIPWRLLVFVIGLFLVVQTISKHGLGTVTATLIGSDGGTSGAFRAAVTGAGMSNVLNNLPSYVAGEAVIPAANHNQLLALLIGTNVGPIITPWASLATLLWYERCRSTGVDIPLKKFMLTGAGLAVAGLTAAVCALLLTG
jgi:arsenical pump membrane protein